MAAGTRRLLRLAVPSPVKAVEKQLDPRERLVLGTNPDGTLSALLDDCADAAVDALVAAPGWTRAEFGALRTRVSAALTSTTVDAVRRAAAVLTALHEVQLALPDNATPAESDAVADIRSQLAGLFPVGFVTAIGLARLPDLARYATAISRRLERLPRDIAGDRDRMNRVHSVEDAYDDLVTALSPVRAAAADVRDIAWQIEELRVSLWAQQLGTPRPVSEQRIHRAIEKILNS